MIVDKISIIIASYNSESVIRVVLDSIVKLNIPNWECIVVDGLSHDNTISIVEEYANKEPRIRYVSEKDHGIYDAFNKGWQLATGKWVYYIGSDDELIPSGIEKLLEVSQDQDCVYGEVLLRNEDGNITYFKSKPSKVLPTAMCCGHQALIMKRSKIEQLGGFDTSFRISADYDLLLRAYAHGSSFLHVPDTPVAFFACTTGVSSKFNMYTIKEQYNIYKKNGVTKFPVFVVSWNFFKRIVRTYIFDPKRKK